MNLVLVNDGAYAYASKALSAVGGAERQQWLLARTLAANGWSVTVGVRDALEAGICRVIEGVKFVGIGQGQVLSAWYRFLSSERPNWWYWHTASHLLGPAFEVAKLAGVRTVYAAAFDSDVRPRHALHWRRRWWPLYAWGLLRADRIFVQHTGQLAELAPLWQSKAYLVPYIATQTPPGKPHVERAQYVAWVGMLRQPKRPDLLIEIARKAPAIRFVVCGSPTPHRSPPGYGEQIINELQQLSNVEYLGKVEPERAQQVLTDAALLLSTSDEEGFPNVFLQAWSSGTPVISLKIDPNRAIAQAKLGRVSMNVEGAVADIHTLMNSPQQREDIAVRARRYTTQVHSEEAVTKAFEDALRGLRLRDC